MQTKAEFFGMPEDGEDGSNLTQLEKPVYFFTLVMYFYCSTPFLTKLKTIVFECKSCCLSFCWSL